MYSNSLSIIVGLISNLQIKVFLTPLIQFLQLLLAVLSLFTNDYQYYPKAIAVTGDESFDYIVVGGGTAGCVVANRLTENQNTTVLVIEAGDIPSIASNTPGLVPLVEYTPEEWNYYSIDSGNTSQALKNKRVRMTAGKLLGGSSGINYMAYNRGAPADYDRWEELGNKGWGWQSVLRYFKISEYLDDIEIYRSNSSSLHGKNGPMKVKRPEWKERTRGYLRGFVQNGREILLDTNGYKSNGYSMGQFTIDDHFRQSTAISYLKPARSRKNLKLLLNTLAIKIVINIDKKATGVEIALQSGKRVIVNAKNEVILCAGALNSPKILMLSGVGPRKHLEECNIPVILDSPNVGENFIDTPVGMVALSGKEGLLQSLGVNVQSLTNTNSFPNPLLIGKAAMNVTQKYADYQTVLLPLPAASISPAVFCSYVFGIIDDICISLTKTSFLTETLFGIHALMHPNSRGNIKLNCSNPEADPVITTNYYSDPNDLERHARYMQDYVSVVDTEYFKSFYSHVIDIHVEKCMNLPFKSLKYWKCFLRNTVFSMWNLSGTCAMGPGGVVDEELRVRGVTGLRVVDASVIPAPVSGNIQAATVMIAEKASDMIKGVMLEEC